MHGFRDIDKVFFFRDWPTIYFRNGEGHPLRCPPKERLVPVQNTRRSTSFPDFTHDPDRWRTLPSSKTFLPSAVADRNSRDGFAFGEAEITSFKS